jgi:tripartite-type tricarboxylate transporter receptor subunit TctC
MNFERRQFLRHAGATAAFTISGTFASAQTFPSRPITVIVGFPAGSAMDTRARVLAERIKAALGQPVIVENVAGAGGSIAVGRVVRAAPDGYTLSIGDMGNYVANQAIYPLQYDLRTDLQPIAMLSTGAKLIVARNGMPATSLKELVAWLRANPGKASVGTGGVGTTDHLAGVIFENSTGTRVRYIPYRGTVLAIQDILAGQIDMAFASSPVALPHVRAGQIKAYAVMRANRFDAAAEIPTVDEAGAPGAHYLPWSALWAPKNTSKEIIAKLNAAVVETLADPTVRARLADLGEEISPRDQQTPEWLGAFHKAEFEKWLPIIKAANMKGE